MNTIAWLRPKFLKRFYGFSFLDSTVSDDIVTRANQGFQ